MSWFWYETVVIASKLCRRGDLLLLTIPKGVLLEKRVFAFVPCVHTFQTEWPSSTCCIPTEKVPRKELSGFFFFD